MKIQPIKHQFKESKGWFNSEHSFIDLNTGKNINAIYLIEKINEIINLLNKETKNPRVSSARSR